ncbi:MAG: HEAT repeat domain-containing protein [Gemmatimonadaceae bacterium]|nr:HEAT repeat domain-containing protein [Gemmatimonadaceae bacterium]
MTSSRFLRFTFVVGFAALGAAPLAGQASPAPASAARPVDGGSTQLGLMNPGAFEAEEAMWTDADLLARRRWSSGDQASDSLYRLGRQALNRGDFGRAASLFQQLRERDPRARIAADALYWHAYAMYRAGGSGNLQNALASLTTLTSEHPRAAISGDARDLRIRVCGELARQGNERCAAEIAAAANAERPERPERPDRVERPERPERGDRGSAPVPQGCPDEDDDERLAALNALLQMDADRALPLLEKTLQRRDRCSVTLRRKAIFLIAQKRDPRAADMLLNAVRNDPDREVRSQAVFWLGQIRDERATSILENLLRTEQDEAVLEKAIFALSQQKSTRAASILRDIALRDSAPTRLREQAIFWLGQQRSGENAELLIGLFARTSNEDIRDKIIFSLSQMRSPATDKFMLDLATDEKADVEMRKKALFWAGQNRSLNVAAIAAMYDRVTNQEMREQVIFVLAQRRDPAAVDKIFDIARNDRDKAMRSKAIFWLGQSRDPRVVKLLEELLNK